MATYAILSRFSWEAFIEPHEFRALAERVSAEIKRQCPDVRWKQSFATLGQYDVSISWRAMTSSSWSALR